MKKIVKGNMQCVHPFTKKVLDNKTIVNREIVYYEDLPFRLKYNAGHESYDIQNRCDGPAVTEWDIVTRTIKYTYKGHMWNKDGVSYGEF